MLLLGSCGSLWRLPEPHEDTTTDGTENHGANQEAGYARSLAYIHRQAPGDCACENPPG